MWVLSEQLICSKLPLRGCCFNCLEENGILYQIANSLFFYEDLFFLISFLKYSVLCCREPNAEQKFKEISNAYEVKVLLIHDLASTI